MAILGPTLVVILLLAKDGGMDHSAMSPSEQGLEREEYAETSEVLEARIERTHGTLGTVAFALLFPLGAILLRRLPGRFTVYIHAAWQLLALCLALTTLGMGVYLAQGTEYIESYHAILGIIAIVGACVQPVTGWLHHRYFKRMGTRGAISYTHMFWGIGIVTLGAINGGFGLVLANEERKYVIVYAVLAALVWIVWMGVSIFSQWSRGVAKRNTSQVRSKNELKPGEELKEGSMP